MNIKKIDVNRVFNKNKSYRCIIYGSTETGKSYYLAKIIFPEIKNNYHKIFIFSKPANESFYKKQFGKNIIFLSKSEKFEKMLTKIQETQANKKNILCYDDLGEPIYKKRLLIIFDDVLDEKLTKSRAFNDLFANGRHLDITTFFLIQTYTILISSLMKSNTQITIICRFDGREMRNRILKDVESTIDNLYLMNGEKLTDKKINDKTLDLYCNYILSKKYGKIILTNNNGLFYDE